MWKMKLIIVLLFKSILTNDWIDEWNKSIDDEIYESNMKYLKENGKIKNDESFVSNEENGKIYNDELFGSSEENGKIRNDEFESSEEKSKNLENSYDKEGLQLQLNKCLSIINSNDIRSCVIEMCSKNCANFEETEENVERKCKYGCKLQADAFLKAQIDYPMTPPKNLLGQALDRCWEDCNGMHLPSISELSSCTRGCNEMRKLQNIHLTASNDDWMESNESGEQSKESETMIKTNDEGEGPVIRTYVLYKNVDVDDMLGGQQDEFYQSLVNIVNNMFSYIDYMDQDQEAFLQNINDCKGYKNDRQQLRLPNVMQQALRQSDMDYSDQKKQSHNEGWFENLKKTIKHSTDDVKRVFSSPVTRDMLFYLFVGVSAFMLLTAMLDLCQPESRKNEDGNEDCFDGEMVKARLPTYEECMEAQHLKYNLQVDLDVDVHTPNGIKKIPIGNIPEISNSDHINEN